MLKKTATIVIIFIFLFLAVIAIIIHPETLDSKYVLISFDVEPVDGKESVRTVISKLEKHNITATFFVTGEYAEQNPDMMQIMKKYEIACHGHSHKVFTKMDSLEKIYEIKKCEEAVAESSDVPVQGFRAPYHRIDRETLEILEQEGFKYDATVIEGISFIFPNVQGLNIQEIKVSSVIGIPIEDVIWIYYLNLNKIYFKIMKNKNTEIESYVFHPHHIATKAEEFDEMLNHLKKNGAKFISHSELISSHEGV
ncbi:polysaccharide deacetylase family protein [Candidatus Woesearchaeota archaeon]|nr:polysaccharide deacetylase family protein [Candidatus Woesearchaeota archaeon]